MDDEYTTPRNYPAALTAARVILRILVPLNIVVGVMIATLLVASLVSPSVMTAVVGGRRDLHSGLILGMRLLAVIGICAIPLAHVLYTRLLAILRSVRAANPFVAENAIRLQTIAWSLAGLQLLQVAAGAVAAAASTKAFPLHVKGGFSIIGWLSVLLVFVLARVFDHGAKMRADLEGTV
jgi:hypothetical protein